MKSDGKADYFVGVVVIDSRCFFISDATIL